MTLNKGAVVSHLNHLAADESYLEDAPNDRSTATREHRIIGMQRFV